MYYTGNIRCCVLVSHVMNPLTNVLQSFHCGEVFVLLCVCGMFL